MITRQELEGKWKQVSGQLREKWGQLTEDDLQQVKGNAEQLVGVIQEKTGQSRREIEAFLNKIVEDGQSTVQHAMDTAKGYAESASRNLKDGYQQVEQNLEAGMGEARQMVQSRPMESIIAAFGAGIISGVVVSLLLRPSRR